MSPEVLNVIAAAVGSVALAAITYLFTKQRERDAALRSEKLNHYKEYVESLTAITRQDSSFEEQKAHALAFNNFHLFAPQTVIEALHQYNEQLNPDKPGHSPDKHDTLLTNLPLEIRKDLQVKPKDREKNFRVFLRTYK